MRVFWRLSVLKPKENGSSYVPEDLSRMMISLLHVLPLANNWWTNDNVTNRNVTNQDLWVVLSSNERKSENLPAKTFVS